MGQTCSTNCFHAVETDDAELSRIESLDPIMYDLMRKSIAATTKSSTAKRKPQGQHHLLYRHHKLPDPSCNVSISTGGGTMSSVNGSDGVDAPVQNCPTRLLIRRRSLRVVEEGGGTHIYAIRYPEDTKEQILSEQATPIVPQQRQEQCPPRSRPVTSTLPIPILEGADVFCGSAMASVPRQEVVDWVTVSEEHNIYIADVGLTASLCDHIVTTTEQACRGQYAAYTYAKQTLGCREYPTLAQSSFGPVHTTVHAIIKRFCHKRPLQLDDREPHIVKYDVTKKERQKLDMHTDKSEWTFLIAMSNGCGVDYEGGGTYFECLDATVHIQRGHALIFPGKLRHCGQKITSGLRFLLVGFLVDKAAIAAASNSGGGGGSSSNSSNNHSSSSSSSSGLAMSPSTPPSPPGVPPVRP